jgi:ATP/maltotriose-dependent transcriptional regulator MalT
MLLTAVEAGPPDALRAAEAEHLRGQIASDQRRVADAAELLTNAARRLEPINTDLARETHLDALTAGIWASGPEAPDVAITAARAARAGPPSRQPERAIDLILDALSTRLTEGYLAAAPLLAKTLETIRNLNDGADDVGRLLTLGGNRVSNIIATELWDFEAGRALADRQVQLARRAGALVQLQFALNVSASGAMLSGDLSAAAALIDEDRMVAEATGNPPIAYTVMLLAALRGDEDIALEQIAAVRDEARSLGQGRIVTFADYATAVLHNGLGRHDIARDAALRVFERDVIGGYQVQAVTELAEAASRTGDHELAEMALAHLTERVHVMPTDWVLGVQARLQALAGDGHLADAAYRESIDRLGRAGLRVEVARGQLLYGEWLRRDGRHVDARIQLRAAHDMLAAMGLEAFAERARRELLAAGEKVRRRTTDRTDDLTPQEFQIARLAREGLSNTEIGANLFLSPRTVEWHLRKVFTKLGVSSRKQLRYTLIDSAPA